MIKNSTTAIIFFIILSVVIGVVLVDAYAEHDYFQSYVSWQGGSPSVCLVNIPPKDLYQTLKAVKSWKVALENYTHSDKWDYNIKVIYTELVTECNIVVIQSTNYEESKSKNTPIGNTTCHESKNLCIAKVNRQYENGSFYYDTIVHEMGHALGLTHRLPHIPEGFPAVFMSQDVMMPVARDSLHITKASLDALIYFDDIYPLIKNYTIPHGDTWK